MGSLPKISFLGLLDLASHDGTESSRHNLPCGASRLSAMARFGVSASLLLESLPPCALRSGRTLVKLSWVISAPLKLRKRSQDRRPPLRLLSQLPRQRVGAFWLAGRVAEAGALERGPWQHIDFGQLHVPAKRQVPTPLPGAYGPCEPTSSEPSLQKAHLRTIHLKSAWNETVMLATGTSLFPRVIYTTIDCI